MAKIIYDHTWLSQPNLLIPMQRSFLLPKINEAHDFSKDLRYKWGAWSGEAGDQLIDLVTHKKSKSWSGPTRLINGIEFNNATHEIQIARSESLEPKNITLIAKCNINGTSLGNYSTIVTKDNTSFSPPYYSYHLRVRTQGAFDRLEFNYSNGSSNASANHSDGSFFSYYDTDVWVAATYDGATSELHLYDTNGSLVLTNSGTGISGDIGYFDTDLHIGDTHSSSTVRGMQGGSKIYDLMIWGHAKQNDEISEIISDPNQMIEPIG